MERWQRVREAAGGRLVSQRSRSSLHVLPPRPGSPACTAKLPVHAGTYRLSVVVGDLPHTVVLCPLHFHHCALLVLDDRVNTLGLVLFVVVMVPVVTVTAPGRQCIDRRTCGERRVVYSGWAVWAVGSVGGDAARREAPERTRSRWRPCLSLGTCHPLGGRP